MNKYYWILDGDQDHPEDKYNLEVFTNSEYDCILGLYNWRLLRPKIGSSKWVGRMIEIDFEGGNGIESAFIFKYEDGWYCVDINYEDDVTDTWVCDQFDGLLKFLQIKLGDIL